MKIPIRKGDQLENGGEVTSGSPYMEWMGKVAARLGGEALCAKHGKTTIAEGDPTFCDQDGKPIAMHLHRCACGCRVIASLTNVHIA